MPTPPVPPEPPEILRRLMHRLFRRFGALAADRTPCGKALSMAHAHALTVLRSRGQLSQQELGGELCIDKSNVTRLCGRMLAAGHVTMQTGPGDARLRLVALTAGGLRLAREVEAASRARFTALLGHVPVEFRPATLTAMEHLVVAVDRLASGDAAEEAVAAAARTRPKPSPSSSSS